MPVTAALTANLSGASSGALIGGTTPAISITARSGYVGSTYTVTNGGSGNWQADSGGGWGNISGETSSTLTLALANEGNAISWLRSDGQRSNSIHKWIPSDLGTEPSIWLDAFTGITESSNLISAWTDRTSNSNDASQGTGSLQLTYEAAGLGTGYPSVMNDGTDNRMTLVATLLGRTTPENNSKYSWSDGSLEANSVADWADNTVAIITTTLTSGAGLTFYNGVADGNDNLAFADGSYAFIGEKLGAQGGSFGRIWDGDVLFNRTDGTRGFNGRGGELIEDSSNTWSTADRQLIEGYIAHRWGRAALLDSGHPYKSDAPDVS